MFKNSRKEELKKGYERSLLEAKIQDKYQFSITKNKMTHTDFLNACEQNQAQKWLQQRKIPNYQFWGGNGADSERNLLLFYPEKFSLEMLEKNYPKIVSAIHITLPKDLHYEHRVYLSGILKCGVKREKVGDILVREEGADIIVLNDVAEFLQNHLSQLTRFQKASCTIRNIQEIEHKEKEFQEFSIIVSSLRLDNVVAELVRCSRTRAVESINEQRVQVNYEIETKFAKKIKSGDVITIRGKGKFIVGEMERKTRGEKEVIYVKKLIS